MVVKELPADKSGDAREAYGKLRAGIDCRTCLECLDNWAKLMEDFSRFTWMARGKPP